MSQRPEENGDGSSEKRRNVIHELIQTETRYVADLKLVIELFLKPLRDQEILTKQELASLFSNLEALVEVNVPLLMSLQEENPSYGEIFLSKSDLFKIYAVYCSNQPRLNNYIKVLSKKPRFQRFLKEAESNPRCRYLRLDDFLIEPMQRICKYPMLLETLASTSDEDEMTHLNEAAAKLRSIVHLINERTRQVERVEQLLTVQSKIEHGEEYGIVSQSRVFVMEGALKSKKFNPEAPVAFLFDDMLLLCSKVISSGKYAVKKVIPFDTATSLKFLDLEAETGDGSTLGSSSGASAFKRFFSGDLSKDTVCLSVEKPGEDGKTELKEYRFRTFSSNEKKAWINAFKKAFDLRAQPRSPRLVMTATDVGSPAPAVTTAMRSSPAEKAKQVVKTGRQRAMATTMQRATTLSLIQKPPVIHSAPNTSDTVCKSNTQSVLLPKPERKLSRTVSDNGNGLPDFRIARPHANVFGSPTAADFNLQAPRTDSDCDSVDGSRLPLRARTASNANDNDEKVVPQTARERPVSTRTQGALLELDMLVDRSLSEDQLQKPMKKAKPKVEVPNIEVNRVESVPIAGGKKTRRPSKSNRNAEVVPSPSMGRAVYDLLHILSDVTGNDAARLATLLRATPSVTDALMYLQYRPDVDRSSDTEFGKHILQNVLNQQMKGKRKTKRQSEKSDRSDAIESPVEFSPNDLGGPGSYTDSSTHVTPRSDFSPDTDFSDST